METPVDPTQIIARLEEGHSNPPTDAELASSAADIRDLLDTATKAETPDLELAKALRDALDTITAEQGKRTEVAEAARAEALALREGIFDDKVEDPENPEDPDANPDDPEAAVVDAEDKTPVAASASDIITRLRSAAAKIPAPEVPKVHGAFVKPIGPAAAYDLKGDAGFRDLGALFSQHGRSTSGKGVATPLVRLTREYPESRQLGSNVQQNNQRIADAIGTGQISREPIAAAGGICGPGDVDHSHPICSQTGRVVTPALMQFNASRGQVTFSPSISIGDLEGNVSIWTSETDANPGQSVKPCPPLTCPEELNAAVDAVVQCVTVGNFQAKFSPEWWAANLEVLAAAHDRLAEQKALEEIHAAGTSVGTVNEGSTLWNFIQLLRNVVSADRSARRNWNGRYTAIADAYGRDQIKNQLVANLGSGVSLAESMAVADATIDGWVRDAGIDNMIWTYDGTYDGSSHRIIEPHSQSGHLPPANFGVEIFPEEAFMFLDGGTLDLGTEISDSVLNATNDRQAFAESFEKVAFRGCSAFHGVVTIDASCGCALTSI
jgi:hypothetical protein